MQIAKFENYKIAKMLHIQIACVRERADECG